MTANRELSLRDIVRVPGKGVGRTVAILEAEPEPTTTVELATGELWTGPVWIVKILRPEYLNRAYIDGTGAYIDETGNVPDDEPPDDEPPFDFYRCQYCGGSH